MLQRRSTFTITQLFTHIVHDFRHGFPQLLAYDLFVKLLGFALLEPFSTWLFTALISTTGRLSISNTQLLTFFLSPMGLFTLLLSSTTTLAVLFIEQAGLMILAARLLWGQNMVVIQALWFMLKRLLALLGLGILKTVIYGVSLVPFVALAALTYVILLVPYSIDYLVAVKPPRFWIAIIIAALLGLGALLLLGVLYVRWIFALPACLFEGKKPVDALRHSQLLTQGSLLRIASILLAWAGVTATVTSLMTVGLDGFGEALLTRLGEQLHVVIPTVAGLITLAGLIFAMLSFIGSTIHCMLIIHLYDGVRARHGLSLAARPEPMAVDDESDKARWALLSKGLWAVVVLLPLLTTVTSVVMVEQLDLQDHIAVTAHRGSSSRAPENTLSAVRQAIEDRAHYAEIDVRSTADGVVVLVHGDDLMRVAGVNKKVRDIMYDRLKDLDVGQWFSPRFAGERIPTLEEVIAVARDNIRLTDLPPCFEQITQYNSLESLVLWSREDVEVSAYILRQLLAGGNGVPNASRIAF